MERLRAPATGYKTEKTADIQPDRAENPILFSFSEIQAGRQPREQNEGIWMTPQSYRALVSSRSAGKRHRTIRTAVRTQEDRDAPSLLFRYVPPDVVQKKIENGLVQTSPATDAQAA
jgi:hypothetical protein